MDLTSAGVGAPAPATRVASSPTIVVPSSITKLVVIIIVMDPTLAAPVRVLLATFHLLQNPPSKTPPRMTVALLLLPRRRQRTHLAQQPLPTSNRPGVKLSPLTRGRAVTTTTKAIMLLIVTVREHPILRRILRSSVPWHPVPPKTVGSTFPPRLPLRPGAILFVVLLLAPAWGFPRVCRLVCQAMTPRSFNLGRQVPSAWDVLIRLVTFKFATTAGTAAITQGPRPLFLELDPLLPISARLSVLQS
mmetsp:Transcript_5041/g.11004  ORF Transcript_5041/g.11004 Transcript_5041/m.11004 type:complete len:247 (+) Transcript_5041:631-1371(+)